VVVKLDVSGVGMTSQRTRNRLTDRLREQGIVNEAVLQVMASTPRHLFVDEALAHRAYEDTALPIGNSQRLRIAPMRIPRCRSATARQFLSRTSWLE